MNAEKCTEVSHYKQNVTESGNSVIPRCSMLLLSLLLFHIPPSALLLQFFRYLCFWKPVGSFRLSFSSVRLFQTAPRWIRKDVWIRLTTVMCTRGSALLWGLHMSSPEEINMSRNLASVGAGINICATRSNMVAHRLFVTPQVSLLRVDHWVQTCCRSPTWISPRVVSSQK